MSKTLATHWYPQYQTQVLWDTRSLSWLTSISSWKVINRWYMLKKKKKRYKSNSCQYSRALCMFVYPWTSFSSLDSGSGSIGQTASKFPVIWTVVASSQHRMHESDLFPGLQKYQQYRNTPYEIGNWLWLGQNYRCTALEHSTTICTSEINKG